MRFKKIYIEITNRCNLNCDFCIKNKRKIHDLTIDEFNIILDKISKYTKDIYLHVLGEPLIHKNVNEFITIAINRGFNVFVTTNGYYINNLSVLPKRVNISLHSYDTRYGISLNVYLDNIFDYIDLNRDKTFFSLRLWADNSKNTDIINYINKRYNLNIKNLDNNTKLKIGKNLLLDKFHEFIWPDINNDYYNEFGSCYGLRNHIGILSDGTIIPCCLDSMGVINLGNIYSDNLDDILSSDIVNKMIMNFRNNKKCMKLCQHCSFLEDKNDN